MADWYRRTMDGMAAWWDNFITRRGDFETKYAVLLDRKDELVHANTWIQYWVQARHNADELSQQLTRYFNTIAGNDAGADAPNPIVWTLGGSAPAEVPPGIEAMIRDVRREVVNQGDYAKADGDAMGFEAAAELEAPVDTMKPDFSVETQAVFAVKFKFKKLGMDGLKVEFRHKGGDWLPAGTLITSPGSLTIAPTTPGTAEQIEFRAFYLQGNNVVGVVSDTKTATIAP